MITAESLQGTKPTVTHVAMATIIITMPSQVVTPQRSRTPSAA